MQVDGFGVGSFAEPVEPSEALGQRSDPAGFCDEPVGVDVGAYFQRLGSDDYQMLPPSASVCPGAGVADDVVADVGGFVAAYPPGRDFGFAVPQWP